MVRLTKDGLISSILSFPQQNIRELHRVGDKYTWTNKQDDPVREVLDRVLISDSWEAFYPLTLVQSLTRVGSDHNPILVNLEKHAVV